MKTWLSNLLLVLAISCPLSGELGGAAESVRTDQARIGAVLKATQTDSYTVYELIAPGRTVIREYVSESGVVFAVGWQGPFIPDLRQLLGTYFEPYSNAVKRSARSRVGRKPLSVDLPGLVVQISGHMRSYFGRAYDPGLVPAEVSVDEIR